MKYQSPNGIATYYIDILGVFHLAHSSQLMEIFLYFCFIHSSFLSLHLAGGLKSFYVQLYQWWQQIGFNRRKLTRMIKCKIVLAPVIMSCWINLIEFLKVQKKKKLFIFWIWPLVIINNDNWQYMYLLKKKIWY